MCPSPTGRLRVATTCPAWSATGWAGVVVRERVRDGGLGRRAGRGDDAGAPSGWSALMPRASERPTGAGRMPALPGGTGADEVPAVPGGTTAGKMPALPGGTGADETPALPGGTGADEAPVCSGARSDEGARPSACRPLARAESGWAPATGARAAWATTTHTAASRASPHLATIKLPPVAPSGEANYDADACRGKIVRLSTLTIGAL